MEDPAQLNHRAEELLAEEQWDEGLALLARALDLAPAFVPALDSLGIVAALRPGPFDDQLFARLEAAENHAGNDDERSRFRWYRLTHLAFHGRLEALAQLAARSQREPDPWVRAAVAALLIELNCDPSSSIPPPDSALTDYHEARRMFARGVPVASARAHLSRIADQGRVGVLRAIGLALLALDENSDLAAPLARAAIARAERQDELGSIVMSELIYLKIRLASVEKRPADAREAARDLGLPPDRHEAGAMVRATRLVGPLTAL